MIDTPIGLRDILSRMSSNIKIDSFIDDLPPLSTHERSLDVWKKIIEFNHVGIKRYLPNPSKKVNEKSLSMELRLWLCSLNYQRGVDVLIHLTSESFIEKNIDYFMINLNYHPIKSYISHRVANKPSHILDMTLDMRIRNLPKVHRRFRSLMTQEDKVKMWIQNYDEICDSICFLIYYLNRLKISFSYPFETMASYRGYIRYAAKKGYLGGLMNSPRYVEVLEYLLNRYSVEDLIDMKITDTIFYDMAAYTRCVELFGDTSMEHPRLKNGIHISIIQGIHDRSVELSREDISIIDERLLITSSPIIDDGIIHLCWNNLIVDRRYLETVLMYVRLYRPTVDVSFKIKTSNIVDQCGSILKMIEDEGIKVIIDLDYENTPSDIMYDLIYHGLTIKDLNVTLTYHKDNLLQKFMGTRISVKPSTSRRGPIPATRAHRYKN